jgi:hypothetical protein
MLLPTFLCVFVVCFVVGGVILLFGVLRQGLPM